MIIPQHSPEPTSPPSGTLRHSLSRLLPVGLALVGIGLSVALGHLDAQRERSEQLGNLAARLAGMRGALEAQLGAAFGEAEGIAQLISADGGISPAHFHGMARDALQSVPYMRHIALAPGM